MESPSFFTNKEFDMDIVNKTVQHKTFGRGKICELMDNIVSVQFGQAVKKFIFPDVFREYLFLIEKQSRQYVDKILADIDADIKLQREKEQRESEKMRLLRSLPLNANSQAAFGFFYNDRKKVAENWNVFLGDFRSGYNLGKPRIPSRIYPNSACLLTFREKNDQEEKRYIWGVFMARENFVGPECTDGIIPAHEKYRIILTENESKDLEFWKYFSNEPGSQRKWGSVEFKYFSNMAMAHILHDILAIKHDTDQQQLCEEFVDYFCELNKINNKQILC
jgi:hypothetical protein